MQHHRYRPSYGVPSSVAAPPSSAYQPPCAAVPSYRTSSTPRTSSASGPSTGVFAARLEFKDNCGVIVEEKNSAGRVLARYRCGRLLGRGGFAKCFEFTNLDTRDVVACKVIEKASLSKPKAWQKLQSEISIHKKMKHAHIVNFISTFQDSYYVYITLELCLDQTLMELTKSRYRFSHSETQYFMLQILSATQYMHENNVIHRDLKLGNVMLHEMVVKIGDFGLAAEVAYDGERKRTICGTPNYIAPEILEGSHSFEVDIWSIGVILYTMLVGKPPFETADVKTTYNRIKQCKYAFPPDLDVPESAKRLVHKILQAQPTKRPTLEEIRGDVFFCVPVPPVMTPASLLADSVVPRARGIECNPAAAPRACAVPQESEPCFQPASRKGREPLRGFGPNVNAQGPLTSRPAARDMSPPVVVPMTTAGLVTTGTLSAQRSGSVPTARNSHSPQAWSLGPSQSPSPAASERQPVIIPTPTISNPAPSHSGSTGRSAPSQPPADDDDDEHHLTKLHDKLHRTLLHQDVGDDAAAGGYPGGPTVWVTDYADFSHKYGLAYRLNGGTTGVHYNDNTKMVWDHATNHVEYIARQKDCMYGTVVAQDVRSSFHMDLPPATLSKKVTLIKYFRTYLTRTNPPRDGGIEVVSCTNHTSEPISHPHPEPIGATSYVKRWMTTKEAIIFRMSNRSIQVCFFDKTEIILSSESKVVTYTDPNGNRASFGLQEAGARSDVAPRLKYTKDILFRLISK